MSMPFESDPVLLDQSIFIPERRDIATPIGITGHRKRAFDLFFVLTTLVLTLPLLGFIALVIKLQDGGPVFFRHHRTGLNGREFACLKFRSMSHKALPLSVHLESDPALALEWAEMRKLRRDPRVTKFGQFLRKSSLDELPQIFNILLGHMSIIGPRPIPADELIRYGADADYYRAAKPGITGLWQVNGRNDTSYQERIAFDVDYVRNWSFGNDLKIIVKTIPVVVFGKGAY